MALMLHGERRVLPAFPEIVVFGGVRRSKPPPLQDWILFEKRTFLQDLWVEAVWLSQL